MIRVKGQEFLLGAWYIINDLRAPGGQKTMGVGYNPSSSKVCRTRLMLQILAFRPLRRSSRRHAAAGAAPTGEALQRNGWFPRRR